MSNSNGRVLKTFSIKRKIKLGDSKQLPVARFEFMPAKYLLSENLPQDLACLKSSDDSTKDISEQTDSFSTVQLKVNGDKKISSIINLSPPQWVSRLKTHPLDPPAKTGRTRVDKRVIEPVFMERLEPSQNKFVFAKSILHPLLSLHSFQQVALLLSALWNDHENCAASDYYMYLAQCTFLTPDHIEELPSFIHLRDYASYKKCDITYEEAIEHVSMIED